MGIAVEDKYLQANVARKRRHEIEGRQAPTVKSMDIGS